MQHLLKASSYVLCQASKTWKQAFRDVFCCHPNIDPFIVSKNGYSTFMDGHDPYYDERAPLTPSTSRSDASESVASCSRSSSESHQLGSNRQEEIRTSSPVSNLSTVNEIGALQVSYDASSESLSGIAGSEKSPVVKQPQGSTRGYGTCEIPSKATSPVLDDDSTKLRQRTFLSLSAPAGLNTLASGSLSPLISPTIQPKASEITQNETEAIFSSERQEPEGSSEISEEDVMKLVNLVDVCIEKPLSIQTDKELLDVVDASTTPQLILEAIHHYVGIMTPELTVACIHHIYAKNCILHERNSDAYNQMCGTIIKDKEFRRLIAILEHNAHSLNNFALLTAASDLLWLRLTLKKKTIPTLLSHVDVEKLTLEELRLLSSCLHTPNIPLVNSEYFYNVSASVAMQEIPNIDDVYTLLNIMKCFGRYFSTDAKRLCESKVRMLSNELWDQSPDGRSKAAHMFDAFYRMEYAPNRAVLQMASDVIVKSSIPIQPQDISAVFRYCVKYGYGFQDMKLLDKLSSELHKSLGTDRASQFTTNVKWLTVFYYYNKDFMQSFVECIKRDMHDLDFVALSDVLDALAQVYFVPDDADEFFDQMYAEMLNKLPTLHTSHVHNAKRKLLLTAFHFAVYGRYPEQLIQLALSESQLSMHMGHSGTRQFLVDLCRAVSVERPDLLPKYLPVHLLQNHGRPKLYAFEKDVQNVLLSVCSRNFFQLMLSPVCFFPFFLLQLRLDGTLLPIHQPGFIPAHRHQMVQNVAVIPLPRSRFCLGSKHAIGKTRLVLRLLRAQGARVITIPHYDWDNKTNEYKMNLLQNKIFNQKTDDVVE
ncbi:FAST kinase domain-containing protein 2, mitochondrial-like [Styela clava]